ncbi:hypothetical protein NGM10_09700 [Halorussus salilacus]|uniref:hypothetical protein n=1 Tax=Halorussus salilacus TaxID=2953750 RepID=UPI0020A16EBA|nr:hypothetical protein [Halorussus salilacus]USZ67002.1 hypothetical protein NGM10_09700 [Halorussus salilacus]
MNRRSALKSLGVAGAAVTGTGVLGRVSAANPDRKYFAIQEAANEIREKQGRQAMLRFLEKKGIGYDTVRRPMVITEKDDDSVSTDEFDNVDGSPSDCDICLDFTLYTNSQNTIYTIDMEWTYDLEASDYGQQPDDGAALYYTDGCWDYYSNSLSETTYTSNYVTAEDDNNNDGIAYSVDDVSAGDGDNLYCGLNIEPIGDCTIDQREVFGQYMHTWTDVEVSSSFGVSFPAGISVSYSVDTEVGEQTTGTEGDGDTLMTLDQSEATLD